MDFVALDVETANPDMSSICQIGLAFYSNRRLVDEWVSLIDPEDYFDPFNVEIHGITQAMVRSAPKLPELSKKLSSFLEGKVCVCHTHFDRVSVGRAYAKYELGPIPTVWLDSARVARRTWADCFNRGYGLGDLCRKIGYTFQPHDALEDAKACGAVFLAAMDESGLDMEGWLKRVEQPINPLSSSVRRDGNPEGPLYGTQIVFTGSLVIPRGEAADLAASLGCKVMNSISKKTDFLVVGSQDITALAGKTKSTKHLKAEEMIHSGVPIRIITEDDFRELVKAAC